MYDKGFIWNSTNSEWECDKSCHIREYLDYQNYRCRKKIVNKLVEECSEIIDESKIIYNSSLNDYKKVCNSCTVYIILLAIFFTISIGIGSVFIYFHWYLIRRHIKITIY